MGVREKLKKKWRFGDEEEKGQGREQACKQEEKNIYKKNRTKKKKKMEEKEEEGEEKSANKKKWYRLPMPCCDDFECKRGSVLRND